MRSAAALCLCLALLAGCKSSTPQFDPWAYGPQRVPPPSTVRATPGQPYYPPQTGFQQAPVYQPQGTQPVTVPQPNTSFVAPPTTNQFYSYSYDQSGRAVPTYAQPYGTAPVIPGATVTPLGNNPVNLMPVPNGRATRNPTAAVQPNTPGWRTASASIGAGAPAGGQAPVRTGGVPSARGASATAPSLNNRAVSREVPIQIVEPQRLAYTNGIARPIPAAAQQATRAPTEITDLPRVTASPVTEILPATRPPADTNAAGWRTPASSPASVMPRASISAASVR